MRSRTTSTARGRPPARDSLRAYFFSDPRRTIQTVLGLLWIVDGALQFQPWMYGRGLIRMLMGMAPAQPHWLASTLLWGAHTMQHNQVLYNSMIALLQIGIGVAILYRPTVKQALLVSCVWSLAVWCCGEAFGMFFMNMASPLAGAPGAAVLYALVAALVWPNERPGGLIGVSGARVLWAQLWFVMGALWLLAVNSSADATSGVIKAAPSGSAWLAGVQREVMNASKGNGLIIAVVLATLSMAIGLAVAFGWRPRTFLGIAIVLNLVYWAVGQGLGGIFVGDATDLNAGPLFVLLSAGLYWLVPYPARALACEAGPARRAGLVSS